MSGELPIPLDENGEERRMSNGYPLSDYIKNIMKIHDEAGITEPEDIFKAMSDVETIMFGVDGKSPESEAVMIDTILEDEALNKKLKWLHLEMHQTQADHFRSIYPRVSQEYLALADRFAEFTQQTHVYGPTFIEDEGPMVRWRGQKVSLSLAEVSVADLVANPSEISIVANAPVEQTLGFLATGDSVIAELGLPEGVDLQYRIQPWNVRR